MATYYYKGLVHNSTQESGSPRDGYVDAKSKKDALVKIANEIGRWPHDSIHVWNGTTGKTVAENLYSQPIGGHGNSHHWYGK